MKLKNISPKKVTAKNDPKGLQDGIFKSNHPKQIALSLKNSIEQKADAKGDCFRSAMARITFYINRVGKNLAPSQLLRLDRAKKELRILFGKDVPIPVSVSSRTRAQ